MFPFDFMFEFDIMFEFDLAFEFDIMFEFDMFVLGTVAMGVGVATLVLLVLLAVLFDVVPPHAAVNAPIPNTAISAIVFIIFLFSCLL